MIGVLMWGGPSTATTHLSGVVWNPSTFDFPVEIKRVKGTDFSNIVENPTQETLSLLTKAAKELEGQGSKAITTDCGFNAIWQAELADSVDVPIFASSLILVPLVSRMLGRERKIGIITARAKYLTDKHLRAVGIDDSSRVCVVGLDGAKEFVSATSGKKKRLDMEKFEGEIKNVARRLVSENSDLGAIVLECTELSAFAGVVQEVTGLPVFDLVILTRMMHDATNRRILSQVESFHFNVC
jgi:hypothetical protein